jgi:hypothetical protein
MAVLDFRRDVLARVRDVMADERHPVDPHLLSRPSGVPLYVVEAFTYDGAAIAWCDLEALSAPP